jgi:protein BCP1
MSAKEAVSSSDDESEEEEEDLVLEGVVTRNPDVSSSSSSEEDEDGDEEKSAEEEAREGERNDDKEKDRSDARVAGSKRKQPLNERINDPRGKKKKRKSTSEPDMMQVEFTFCDMAENFFHSLKSLLHSSSTVYQNHSSNLAELMIENVSVGTAVSTTEADRKEGNLFGFASVLNITTYQESEGIQYLKSFCLQHCPENKKKELEVVLSGKTPRPAGFLLHGRFINLPLEIVYELHDQLVKDMDWAVVNAEGGEAERKALDFGGFVILAPCQQEGGSMVYKYFDDEIFAGQAEFHFTVDAPNSYSKEEKQLLTIMVLTKTGHRAALEDLRKMVQPGR